MLPRTLPATIRVASRAAGRASVLGWRARRSRPRSYGCQDSRRAGAYDMGNRTSNTSHRFGARKITGGGQTSRKRGPRAGSTIGGVGGQITLNPNLFDGMQGHAPLAADDRTPQPECPRRDIRLDPRRREGTTCAADVLSPGTCYSRSSNIAVRAWG